MDSAGHDSARDIEYIAKHNARDMTGYRYFMTHNVNAWEVSCILCSIMSHLLTLSKFSKRLRYGVSFLQCFLYCSILYALTPIRML